jgi:hypothetical protein
VVEWGGVLVVLCVWGERCRFDLTMQYRLIDCAFLFARKYNLNTDSMNNCDTALDTERRPSQYSQPTSNNLKSLSLPSLL